MQEYTASHDKRVTHLGVRRSGVRGFMVGERRQRWESGDSARSLSKSRWGACEKGHNINSVIITECEKLQITKNLQTATRHLKGLCSHLAIIGGLLIPPSRTRKQFPHSKH